MTMNKMLILTDNDREWNELFDYLYDNNKPLFDRLVIKVLYGGNKG